MSVVTIVRVKGNPADLEQYAAGPGGEIMCRASKVGRSAGAIRHTFAGNEDEVLIIDEWPDATSFQTFFASHPDVAEIMRDGGTQGAPEITFYRKLDTPDQF